MLLILQKRQFKRLFVDIITFITNVSQSIVLERFSMFLIFVDTLWVLKVPLGLEVDLNGGEAQVHH